MLDFHRDLLGFLTRMSREYGDCVALRLGLRRVYLLTHPDLSPGAAPFIDLHFEVDGADMRFFSVVSTIGTPIDVTAQELRFEAFFPADDATRATWPSFVTGLQVP